MKLLVGTVRVSVVLLGILLLAIFFGVNEVYATQYLINFDDLSDGRTFGPHSQPYRHLDGDHGIVIGGHGHPTVISPEYGAYSSPYALRNEPVGEFLSAGEDLEVTLIGFKADSVRVYVGLQERSPYPIVATMVGYHTVSGTRTEVARDEVNLGRGPIRSYSELSIDSPGGGYGRPSWRFGVD